MSWITNAQYVPAPKSCECQDGTYDIMICDVKYEQYQGKNVLAVFFHVNAPTWNKIPYRHTIFEGENFDYGLSRLCDCFGVNFQEVIGGNFNPFVNKVGKAEFSHTKQKKVVTGYDQSGKPIEEWKTERSQYVNAKLIEKAQPQEAEPAPVQQPAPPMSQADANGMAQAFGTPNTPGTPTF